MLPSLYEQFIICLIFTDLFHLMCVFAEYVEMCDIIRIKQITKMFYSFFATGI